MGETEKAIRIECEGAAMVPLARFKDFQGELKVLTEPRYQKLKTSIANEGFSFPMFIWRHGGRYDIIDGHQRLKTVNRMIKEEGYTLIGGALPVAYVSARTKKEAKRKVLLAASQFGRYDEQSVYNFIQASGIDFDNLRFEIDLPQIGLTKIDKWWREGKPAGGNGADALIEPPKKPTTKAGDVWAMGDHVLVCGDSRNPVDVDADLLVTDPPYGVDYGAKNEFLKEYDIGNSIQTPIENDGPGEAVHLWADAFSSAEQALARGACYYVTAPPGDPLLPMLEAMRDARIPSRHSIAWVKNHQVLTRTDYHYRHELVLYGWKEGAKHKFRGMNGETSVWEIARPESSKLHPTMKPVELFARAIRNGSDEGDTVLDIFAGSGTTVIAAEELGRRAFAVEIAPAYCDGIVERWQQFSGGKATRRRSLPRTRRK